MSQLDQAFIRAYNRQLAASRPSAHVAASGTAPVSQESPGPDDTVIEAVAQLLREVAQPLVRPKPDEPKPDGPHFVTSATAGTYDMLPDLHATPAVPEEPQTAPPVPTTPPAPNAPPAPQPAPTPAPSLEPLRAPLSIIESPVAPAPTLVAQPVDSTLVDSQTAPPSDSSLQPLSQVLGLHELSPQAHAPFRAAWEVDTFQWPEVCDLLLEASAELLDEIAGRIHLAAGAGRNLIVVRGSRRGTGATAAAAFFARVMAGTGLHVALVDGHLAHPQLGKQLGLGHYTGWDHALAGEAALEETAVASLSDALTLLPMGQLSESQQMQVDPDRVAENLHRLAADFDLIVIDAGAVSISRRQLAGMPGLPSEMAATLLVTDARRSGRRPAGARRLIAEGGELLIGVFENFAPSDDATSSHESVEIPPRKLAA